MKRENPYNRLKRICTKWAGSVIYPHKRLMWRYPKDKITHSWRLDDLAERVQAADQLGYDVKLEWRNDGLAVLYVKRPDEIPWELKY